MADPNKASCLRAISDLSGMVAGATLVGVALPHIVTDAGSITAWSEIAADSGVQIDALYKQENQPQEPATALTQRAEVFALERTVQIANTNKEAAITDIWGQSTLFVIGAATLSVCFLNLRRHGAHFSAYQEEQDRDT